MIWTSVRLSLAVLFPHADNTLGRLGCNHTILAIAVGNNMLLVVTEEHLETQVEALSFDGE